MRLVENQIDIWHNLPKALNCSENLNLLEKYADTHDPKIKKILVEGNLRLVTKSIRKYFSFYISQSKNYRFDFEDLAQTGTEILINAIEKYKFNKENPVAFSTYLDKAIKNNVYRYLMREQREKCVQVESDETLQFLVESKKDFNAVFESETDFISDDICKLLTEHQKKVVVDYFFKGRTLKEIGEEFGCSRQATKSSLDAALKRIKEQYFLIDDPINPEIKC